MNSVVLESWKKIIVKACDMHFQVWSEIGSGTCRHRNGAVRSNFTVLWISLIRGTMLTLATRYGGASVP